MEKALLFGILTDPDKRNEEYAVKIIIRLVFVSVLMAIAAPAYSGSVSQFFRCEQDDDASEQDLINIVSKWLNEAKKVKGGENLRASLHFPIAAAMGETDFSFVLTAPSATEWGTFVDNVGGSEIAEINAEWDELAACPDSALIRSVEVK